MDGSLTNDDDVFLDDHIPYGSPGNPIDDCGVVEIDLVSTEVHTEYETVEEAEHYDPTADYEADVTHVGESVNSEYSPFETEGEIPIIVEENKAAINLAKNFEMLSAPATSSTHPNGTTTEKLSNKVNMTTIPPPPNQIQILAASLAGGVFQSSNITVNKKPTTESSITP